METYIFKLIVCSAVFIVFYYLIFERLKNHRFKRFYLLSSVLFSMLIPLISITYGVENMPAEDFIILENTPNNVQYIQKKEFAFSFQNMIILCYGIVVFALILKFIINFIRLRKEISSGEKLPFGKHFLVLKSENNSPYSFWNSVVVNKNDYESGKIDEKILLHEKAHLDQKHSLDLIFIEILLIFFWFNPAFYFFKYAIITNHEFLADETVLKNQTNVKSYQKLLLSELISERILFTHPFNLSNTKKRIKMMTTPNSHRNRYLSWITFPLAAALFFIFVEKIPAKIKVETKKQEAVAVPVDEKNLSKAEKELIRKMREEPENIIDLRKAQDTVKPKNIQKAEETPSPPPPPAEPTEKIQKSKPAEPPLPPTQNGITEIPAEFPGGSSALRMQLGNTFNTAVFKGNEGLLKTIVFFEIDENGKTSNYRAEGSNEALNKEALRTIKAVNENVVWKPATANGFAIKSFYKLPFAMSFTNQSNSK